MKDVTLNIRDGGSGVFSFKHAQNILRQDNHSGFHDFSLPEDSEYIFQNGNLITRPDPVVAKSPTKRGTVKEGD